MLTDDARKKYSSYAVEELLQDDYFIISTLSHAEETETFWEEVLEEGKLNRDDYELARYFIHSLQAIPDDMTGEEIYTMWENIEVRNKENLRKKKRRFRLYALSMTGAVAVFILLFLLNYKPSSEQQHRILCRPLRAGESGHRDNRHSTHSG